jgi:hypothetical protein
MDIWREGRTPVDSDDTFSQFIAQLDCIGLFAGLKIEGQWR